MFIIFSFTFSLIFFFILILLFLAYDHYVKYFQVFLFQFNHLYYLLNSNDRYLFWKLSLMEDVYQHVSISLGKLYLIPNMFYHQFWYIKSIHIQLLQAIQSYRISYQILKLHMIFYPKISQENHLRLYRLFLYINLIFFFLF